MQKMSIWVVNTINRSYYQWPIEARTQTDRNSSCNFQNPIEFVV